MLIFKYKRIHHLLNVCRISAIVDGTVGTTKFGRFAGVSSSIIKERLEYFSEVSKDWWNPLGNFSILHEMNPFRMEFICSELNKKENVPKAKPLEGLKVLDVGCGGGIVSESLSHSGADVTGIDPSEMMIKVAKNHSMLNPSIKLKPTYITSTLEEHALSLSDHYDVIVVFFVFEHLENREEFLRNCFKVLKPGGSLFINHGNKTWHLCVMYIWNTYVTKRFPKGVLTLKVYQNLPNRNNLLDMLFKVMPGKYRTIGLQGITMRYFENKLCWTASDKYWGFIHGIKTT